MTEQRYPFEYAVLRVIPRVERGESINAGVLVYCHRLGYLGSRVHLDQDRLRALDPTADPVAISSVLRSLAGVCSDAAVGPTAEQSIGQRFRQLTAPKSTVIQPGPVHTGLTTDPAAETERLLRLLVLP
ncbi:DUF3037 domain-containing protein [Crossiella cryophila]|uniref:DUF3037 domain-containing protein n=1 Tax=Crossiella cryophila TaxID=43355 RepID=A0A7W7C3S5_9PSEU|nr:DUF3037 domain-containing protein [Crossiella cryophila]MBB4673949.1 hypothetical protein [Crossiella cryophila]